MSPVHGTTSGYRTHGCRCIPCTAANTRYDQYRRLDEIRGIQRRVSSIGSRRRVQALATMGWSLKEVAKGCGWKTEQAVHRSINRDNVNSETADRIAAFYDEHRDEVGPSAYTRTRARNLGYQAPDRWFDIDDPNEQPDPGYIEGRPSDEFDLVIVDRVVGGDFTLAATATKPERVEIVARWIADGRALNELERRTGWQPRRYIGKAA